jgi:hypothetical protein
MVLIWEGLCFQDFERVTAGYVKLYSAFLEDIRSIEAAAEKRN